VKFIILTGLITYLVVSSAFAQSEQHRNKHFNLKNNVTIQGYDLVSCFVNNKAIEGNKKFQSSSNGIIYYFTSIQSKESFGSNPERFEPFIVVGVHTLWAKKVIW